MVSTGRAHLPGLWLFIALVGWAGSSVAGSAAQAPPNILLIVADDLGYSDIASYGGEIATPHLDALAERGLRFSDFAVAPTCSTTRSILLTGVDNHLNGLGGLDSSGRPRKEALPGYEGYLNSSVRTLAAYLQEQDYHTYMAGKWHLGHSVETGPENHGFESAFVMPGGAASHFADRGVISGTTSARYRENGQPATVPDDFYSSTFFTDKLIAYIEKNKGDGKPFFAYASYTAPHWPLQAPDEVIDQYAGVYEVGYDAIRAQRLKRLQALGFIRTLPAGHYKNPIAREWASLSAELKTKESRRMQVYAAMVEVLDANIGRLLDYIEASAASDNTVVIFISDNGPEGNDPFVIARNESWVPQHFNTDTASLGKPGSFSTYGPAWAAVSATPYSYYKAFPGEGGIRVPAIFVLPGRLANAGGITHEFASVLDIAPTLLALAGVKPETVNAGKAPLLPLQGKSLLDFLSGKAAHIRKPGEIVGWELLGRKAIRSGEWKLLWVEQPYGEGRWVLHNLARDPLELTDLAQKEPEQMALMQRYWRDYAEHNNVVDYTYSNIQYGSRNQHYQR